MARYPGRPTSYKPEYAELANGLALLGLTHEEMAKALRIATSTFYEWLKQHEEFSEAVYCGGVPADAEVAMALYKEALKGNVPAAKHWLNNRQRSKWADRQEIEHSGSLSSAFAEVDEEVAPLSMQGGDD